MEPITDHMRNVSLSRTTAMAASGPDDAASTAGGGDGGALVSGGTGKAATSGKDNVRRGRERGGEISAAHVLMLHLFRYSRVRPNYLWGGWFYAWNGKTYCKIQL